MKKLKTVAITVYFFATQSLFHYTDALKCSYHKIKLKNKIKPRYSVNEKVSGSEERCVR